MSAIQVFGTPRLRCAAGGESRAEDYQVRLSTTSRGCRERASIHATLLPVRHEPCSRSAHDLEQTVSEDPEKTIRLADRLALRPKEAAAVLGLSERAFRALLPSLPHVRAGGAVLVPVESLRRWLDDQAAREPGRVDAIVTETLRSIRD